MYLLFFFNDTATTEIYTLSLHDALPILPSMRHLKTTVRLREVNGQRARNSRRATGRGARPRPVNVIKDGKPRSEEHTSELQSRQYLVCRLLLEKKKK